MRLTKEELVQIKAVFSGFMENAKGCLYLYGSRVDAQKKGGDIDLLLVLDPDKAQVIKKKKLDILVDLKEQLGDQKIDLVICAEEELQKDPFLKGVMPEALLLIEME